MENMGERDWNEESLPLAARWYTAAAMLLNLHFRRESKFLKYYEIKLPITLII